MSYSNSTEELVLENAKYPKSVFFIIGNEFCERFSYYGMKTILTLYLVKSLLYSNDDATSIYHFFSMAAYFTPVLGAALADSFLGKFKTILYLSLIYVTGSIVISISAIPMIPSPVTFAFIGLGLIALGTGGIKPCVSAFGGDQFGPNQLKWLGGFFSLFYLSINAGSLLSTFITPYLKEEVPCFGQETCYPLAFGIPAILMAVAIVCFVAGHKFYRIVPPSGNILLKVAKCISHALSKKWFSKEKKIEKEHWLDYADDEYDSQLIQDVKGLFHVLVLYLPLPLFWALFDQQGSRWTIQAANMNGDIGDIYTILPEHTQVINPLLIIAFIPLFNYVIYPVLAKCNLLTKPLQKMTVGGLLAAGSFLIAGFIQLKIEATLPLFPQVGHSQVSIINQAGCDININGFMNGLNLAPFSKHSQINFTEHSEQMFSIQPFNSSKNYENLEYSFTTQNKTTGLILLISGGQNSSELVVDQYYDIVAKPTEGDTNVMIISTSKLNYTLFKDRDHVMANGKYSGLKPGGYSLLRDNGNDTNLSFVFKSGGSYIITVDDDENEFSHQLYIQVDPNSFHMLWLIVQYLAITASEILFSITGLEFSYSQAPASMKSVLQAMWLLTVAFGNLIVVVIAQLKLFDKQSYEFFMFGIIMVLDMVLFAVLAYFYKPINNTNEDDSNKIQIPEKPVPFSPEKQYSEETRMKASKFKW